MAFGCGRRAARRRGRRRVAYAADWGLTVYEDNGLFKPFLKMDVALTVHREGGSFLRGVGGKREGEAEGEAERDFGFNPPLWRDKYSSHIGQKAWTVTMDI